METNSHPTKPRISAVVFKPPPVDNGDASRSRQATVAGESESLKGKRKAAEIKKDDTSGSASEIGMMSYLYHRTMVTRATENYLAAKKVKTHHNGLEVGGEAEVLVVEDSDRGSSPLTELSPSSLASPPSHLPEAPPTSVSQDLAIPAQILTPAPVRQSETGPTPSRCQTTEEGNSVEELGSELDTPHTVLEPLPNLDMDLVLTPKSSPVASGSRKVEEKPSISIDRKPKLKGKKKGASEFTMDNALRDKRLQAVGPDFEVDNDRIRHQHAGSISRATMSSIFGGNPQRMICYISAEKKRIHGFTSPLLFPNRNFNPLLPTKIGERGLLFRLDQNLQEWVDNEGGVGPYHLMMHHTSDDYCYFGVYQFVRVDPVTRDEWLAQTSQVWPFSF